MIIQIKLGLIYYQGKNSRNPYIPTPIKKKKLEFSRTSLNNQEQVEGRK